MQEINLDNFENYIYDNYQVRISVETPCVIDENKPNCVFGVLVSLEGLKIKDDFLRFLEKMFNVWVVEQELKEKNLFEYPAIKYLELLIKKTNKSCLYIHTKGAYFKHDNQTSIRYMWKYELLNHKNWYFNIIEDEKEAIVSTMFTGQTVKNTWFNCFVANKNVFNDFTVEQSEDRYFYERLFRLAKHVKVIGRIYNDIEDEKDIHRMFEYTNNMFIKYLTDLTSLLKKNRN